MPYISICSNRWVSFKSFFSSSLSSSNHHHHHRKKTTCYVFKKKYPLQRHNGFTQFVSIVVELMFSFLFICYFVLLNYQRQFVTFIAVLINYRLTRLYTFFYISKFILGQFIFLRISKKPWFFLFYFIF